MSEDGPLFFQVMDGLFCFNSVGVESADIATVRHERVSAAGAMLRDIADAEGPRTGRWSWLMKNAG